MNKTVPEINRGDRLRLERPLIFFDLETTGVSVAKDRIVQLAALKFYPVDGLWDATKHKEISLLINPGMPIPVDATAVHGITNEHVLEKPKFADIAKHAYAFFKNCDLAGYNSDRFDVPMLLIHLRQCGYDLGHPRLIDAFKIFKNYCPQTLSGAYKRYTGETLVDAHDALIDVRATVDVFKAQLMEHSDLPRTVGLIDEAYKKEGQLDMAGQLVEKNGLVVLAFGKHKGKHVCEIPKAYLDWCYANNVIGQDAKEIIEEVMKNNAS